MPYLLNNMDLERFKVSIEYPLQKVDDFWMWMRIKSVISRTLRIALRNPDLAKEYLESLPKATQDNEKDR